MAAHAIFSADASRIFRATRQIREELNNLKRLATTIRIGGGAAPDASPFRQVTNEVRLLTAELRRQAAAHRAAAEEQRAQKENANRAAAQTRANTASIQNETAALNRQAAQTRVVTSSLGQQAAAARANSAAYGELAAESRALAAASNQTTAANRAAASAIGTKTAAARLDAAESTKQAAASRAQAAASNATAAAARANSAVYGELAAESRAVAAASNQAAAASRATAAGHSAAAAASNAQAASSRAATAATNAQTAGIRQQTAASNAASAATRQQAAAAAAAAATARRDEAAVRARAKGYRDLAYEVQKAAILERKAHIDALRRSGVKASVLPQFGQAAVRNINVTAADRRALAAIADETERGARAARQGQTAFERFRATILAFATGYLVIQGLFSAFRALKYAVIDFNATLDSARIGFTTMLDGSRAAAGKLLNQLQMFARTTPFEFKDLIPLTQRMMALGVTTKDNLIPALRAIGNQVAALGGGSFEIDRIVRALGQMANKGRAYSEEVVRQLGEVGVKGLKYLAESMGVGIPQIFEYMKKGMIDGKTAVKVILAGMQRDFASMMEQQSRTFIGAWSNIKDAATALTAAAFRPLYDSLAEMAVRIAEVANTREFERWATETAGRVTTAFAFIKGAFDALFDTVTGNTPLMIAMLAALTIRFTLMGVAAFRSVMLPIPALRALRAAGNITFIQSLALGARTAVIAIADFAQRAGVAILSTTRSLGLMMIAATRAFAVFTISAIRSIPRVIATLAAAALAFLTLAATITATMVVSAVSSIITFATSMRASMAGVGASLVMAGRAFITFAFVQVRTSMVAALRAITTTSVATVMSVLRMIAPFLMVTGVVAGFVYAYKNDIGGLRGFTTRIVNSLVDSWKRLAEGAASVYDWIDKNIFGGEGGFLSATKNELAIIESGAADIKESLERNLNMTAIKKFVADQFNSLMPDMAKINREIDAMKATLGKEGKIEIPSTSPTDPKGEDKEAKARERARKKLRADQLQDEAKFWDLVAREAEASAKRQMAAFTSVRDKFRELFGSAQESLLREGIISNPLEPIIQSFEKWVGLEPRMRALATATKAVVDAARQRQGAAQSALDRQQGGDGYNPGLPSGGSRGSVPGAPAVEYPRGFSGPVDNRSFDANLINSIIYRALNTPMGKMACARFVNSAFETLGIGFQGSESAAQMERQAARVAKRIPVSQAGAGDLLVGPGGGPSGRHVGIGVGNGMFAAKNNDRHSRIAGYGFDAAYDTSALARGGMARPNGTAPRSGPYMPRNNAAGVAEAYGAESDGVREMFENLDGALSLIAKVPAAWGKAVRDTDQTTAQFTAQTLLASKEFQAYLTILAETSRTKGQTVAARFDEIVKKIRATVVQTDALRNKMIAIRKSEESVRDIEREIRTRGMEGDAVGLLRDQFAHDPARKFTPKPQQQWEIFKMRQKVVGDMQRQTDLFVQSQRNQIGVLAAGDRHLRADTVSLMEYERAVELANIRLGIHNDLRDQLNSKDAGVRNSAQQQEASRIAAANEAYDTDKIKSIQRDLYAERAAMQDRASVLTFEAEMIRSGTLAQYQREDATEAATKGLEVYNRVLAANVGRYGEALAEEMAFAEALESVNALMADRAITRQIENLREYDQAVRETTRTLSLATQQQQIYFSGMNSPDTERALAMAQRESELRAEAETRGYTEDDIQDRLGLFGQTFDAEVQTKAAGEFAKQAQDAARATATWGDMTGLASMKFDQAHGSLRSLSDAQKQQMLVTEAGTLGLQRFGQEYDSLFSRQFSMQQSLDAAQRELAGGFSERARQELEWKYEDAEMMARINGMTEDQRAAYLKQKPAVDALRTSTLALLDAEQAVAFLRSNRDHTRTMSLMFEQDATRRALQEFKYQLLDAGLSDDPSNPSYVYFAAQMEMREVELETQKSIDAIRETYEGVQGVFAGAWDELYQNGPMGFFDKVATGFSEMLNKMAEQVLSSYLTSAFMKLFPQMGEWMDASGRAADDMQAEATQRAADAIRRKAAASGASAVAAQAEAAATAAVTAVTTVASGSVSALADQTNQAAQAATQAAAAYTAATAALIAYTAAAVAAAALTGGAPVAPGGVGGGETMFAAIGMDRVPYNGMNAVVHKDEAILNATDAETWRGMKQGVVGGPGSRTGAGGGNITVVNTFQIGNIAMPEGTDADALVDNLQQRASRRTEKQQASDWMRGGYSQR